MWKKLTDKEKKALENFPKYDGEPIHWVGSREYWESIFNSESNRDPELHIAFSELHHKIIDMIVSFCKEHNLENVDEVYISADGLRGSMDYGEWTCFTDSSMSFIELKDNLVEEWNASLPDRDNPFLYEI